jgi:hypothetical protein
MAKIKDRMAEEHHFLITHPRGTCKICDHIRLLLEFDIAMQGRTEGSSCTGKASLFHVLKERSRYWEEMKHAS